MCPHNIIHAESTIPKTLWGNVVCATISIDEKLAIIGIFKGRLLKTSLFVRTPLRGQLRLGAFAGQVLLIRSD